MFGRYGKAAVAVILALSLSGGIVAVAQAQADVIKARQENRKALNEIGREMFKQKDGSGDLAHLAELANKAADLNKAFAGMFPPGSDKGDTLAAPAIWTDRAGFDAANKESVDVASKIAALAKAGDRDGLPDQFKAMGRTCGTCHRAYTTSDPFKKK
jgi:cytochrome c556